MLNLFDRLTLISPIWMRERSEMRTTKPRRLEPHLQRGSEMTSLAGSSEQQRKLRTARAQNKLAADRNGAALFVPLLSNRPAGSSLLIGTVYPAWATGITDAWLPPSGRIDRCDACNPEPTANLMTRSLPNRQRSFPIRRRPVRNL